LVGLRDYQDGKADVILKYSADEARNLKAYGELPESGRTYLITCLPKIVIYFYCGYLLPVLKFILLRKILRNFSSSILSTKKENRD
jgi:hypothetical protein